MILINNSIFLAFHLKFEISVYLFFLISLTKLNFSMLLASFSPQFNLILSIVLFSFLFLSLSLPFFLSFHLSLPFRFLNPTPIRHFSIIFMSTITVSKLPRIQVDLRPDAKTYKRLGKVKWQSIFSLSFFYYFFLFFFFFCLLRALCIVKPQVRGRKKCSKINEATVVLLWNVHT